MNVTSFLQTYPSILFSPEGDHRFETLRLLTRGHSSAKQAKLLNYAARFLGDNECYLEIGTYTGFTLCSAGLESVKKFVGIDNFSEPYIATAQILSELKKNVERYVSNFRFKPGDFRTVSMADLDNENIKIGVFYVDGKHTYKDVIESIEWARPRFSNETLIMFDDLNVAGVENAVDWILEDPRFREIFRGQSFFDAKESFGMMSDPYIHNGFSLVVYRGKDGLQ